MFKNYLSSFKPEKSGDYQFNASHFDINEPGTVSEDDFKDASDEPIGKPKNDWKSGVTKSLMKGLSKEAVIAKHTIGLGNGRVKEAIVAFVNSFHGLIGTMVVDCGNLDKGAYQRMSNKNYHCYAYNCNCFQEKVVMRSRVSSGGSLDAALQSKELVSEEKIKVCQKTGLPVISSFKEVNDSRLNNVVKELAYNGGIGSKTASKILKSKNKLVALKNTFSSLNVSKVIKDEMPVVDGEYKSYGLNAPDFAVDTNSAVDAVDIRNISVPDTIEDVFVEELLPGDAEIEQDNGDIIDIRPFKQSLDIDPVDTLEIDDCPTFDVSELFISVNPPPHVTNISVGDINIVNAKIDGVKDYDFDLEEGSEEIDIDGEQDENWI